MSIAQIVDTIASLELYGILVESGYWNQTFVFVAMLVYMYSDMCLKILHWSQLMSVEN